MASLYKWQPGGAERAAGLPLALHGAAHERTGGHVLRAGLDVDALRFRVPFPSNRVISGCLAGRQAFRHDPVL